MKCPVCKGAFESRRKATGRPRDYCSLECRDVYNAYLAFHRALSKFISGRGPLNDDARRFWRGEIMVTLNTHLHKPATPAEEHLEHSQ